MYTGKEKVKYDNLDLNPPIREEIFDELRRMSLNVHYNFIDTRHISAAEKRSQCAFMEHVQLRLSRIIKSSQNGLRRFMLCETPDAPSTRTALPQYQGTESRLHPLATVKDVLKVEELLLLKFNRTADDLHDSLQQQYLSS